MVPLRVLSRTNLAESFLHFPHNPQSFSSLPPLEISCLSFSDRRPLFSMACSLFSQNTGEWGISAPAPRPLHLLILSLEECVTLASVFVLPFADLYALLYLPLESTLAKVHQNKQLHLPLESTLVRNPGRGGIIVN